MFRSSSKMMRIKRHLGCCVTINVNVARLTRSITSLKPKGPEIKAPPEVHTDYGAGFGKRRGEN
jgi:hypothetical protein